MPALIIDTTAKDGGLRKRLTDAWASAEVIAHITDTVGAEDLTDFVRACIHAAYETEVQTVFFDGVAQHKDNPIQLSRLSAAWLAAYKSQQRQQAMNPDATQNIEEPLGTTHKEEFATAWNVHYAKISFNEYLTGVDGLTARQFLVAWLLQHDRVHVVAEYTASGEAIPYCRTGQGTPFRSEPRRTGHGAVSAIEAGHVCAKCVDRVPRATLCAITDA